MSLYLSLPLLCTVIMVMYMTIVWCIGRILRNNSIVDVFWAFNFLVIAAVILSVANGFELRILMVTGLLSLWSIRLGTYLGLRVGKHIKEEEGRYKQLREEWAANVHFKFFIFFQMQGISNVFLSIPFFIIALNPNPEIHWMEFVGAFLWIIAILGEGLSDFQLSRFKKNPDNKGKVCDAGLWNYSRHPNYFFQCFMWVAVLLFALPSPHGFVAIVCPITIVYLIFKVTGIPMTEEQALRSKGEAYAHYQATTSRFIPWFKKTQQQ